VITAWNDNERKKGGGEGRDIIAIAVEGGIQIIFVWKGKCYPDGIFYFLRFIS